MEDHNKIIVLKPKFSTASTAADQPRLHCYVTVYIQYLYLRVTVRGVLLWKYPCIIDCF